MKKICFALALVLLQFSFCLNAAKPIVIQSNPAFEAEIAHVMDSLKTVGLSVAIVKDNAIIYTHSFGVKNLESKEPVTDATMFRIASISKSFSATSIMQLVEKGKLKLTDDVSTLVGHQVRNPKFPDMPITVAMLMSHTSSINDSEGYYITLDCINPDKNPNWKNCYNSYAPGSGYEYCNLNYNLLGSIIEKVSGERFDQYVKNHILLPLGITGSGFNLDEIDRSSLATLYAWNGKEYEAQPGAYTPRDFTGYEMGKSTVLFSPAGGMKITATNLAKYMLMHMNYGKSPLAKQKVLKKKSSQQMQLTYGGDSEEQMGFGLCHTSIYVPGVELVGHTGGAYGLRSAMFFDPASHYGLVMICSGSTGNVLKAIMPVMHKHFIAK